MKESFACRFQHAGFWRVITSPATLHPDETWIVAQADAFVKHARNAGRPVGCVQHDQDTMFTATFDV